jgi:hypothetical protein
MVNSELDYFGVAHRSCVAIDQKNFVAGGRERLQQKHPEMRHEVLRDAVVGVVEKNFQFAGPERQPGADGFSPKQMPVHRGL